jgi:acyl carrier protein
MTLPPFPVDIAIASRVRRVVLDHTTNAPEGDHPGTTTLAQLGADSLDAMQIVMRLEEEFDIEIDHDQVDTLDRSTTLADLTALVAGKAAA